MVDVQQTIRKLFPSMSINETILHILYSTQKDGVIQADKLRVDYSSVIDDLIKKGFIIRDKNLKFTERGLEKINYLRDMRGLSTE